MRHIVQTAYISHSIPKLISSFVKDLLKKYNTAIYCAQQSAAVWIWHCNELKSDSLGPVHLQIHLFWACFTQIFVAIRQSYLGKALSEQVPNHIFVIFSYCTFMKYCNGGHEQESKTRTKPLYTSVWGQPQGKSETIVSLSELLLRRPIYRPKATRNGDGARIYKTNTNEYL